MMKKFVLGMSLMMALAAAPSVAFAAGEGQQQCEKGKKECVEKKSCQEGKECSKGEQKGCKKSKKGKKGGDGRFAGRHGKMDKGARRASLFEGITLSDAQQQKLTTLDNKVKAERQEAMAKAKAEREKAIAKADKERSKARADYDKALSDILTPEQYAKYQENQKALQAKRMEKRAAKEAKMKAGKDGKKDQKMKYGKKRPQKMQTESQAEVQG